MLDSYSPCITYMYMHTYILCNRENDSVTPIYYAREDEN